MVERVARAICKSHGLHPDADAFKHGALRHYPIWQTYEEDAVAAIKAMREPTQEMLLEAHAGHEPLDAKEAWQFMIDEALKGAT